MSALTIPLAHGSTASDAVRTGVAVAVTVAVFYSLCAAVWLAAPVPFLGFMNSLFHGMDFSALVRPAPFSWAGYLEALVVLSIWSFLAGTFFAWMHRSLTD